MMGTLTLIPKPCFKCGLSKTRKKQVVGRGVLPCQVLFIGEGPGKSEDCQGTAFFGSSGELLNDAINLFSGGNVPSYFITNVVQCRPTDNMDGPNRQPSIEEALACQPNLMSVYKRANPAAVVLLGKVAARHTIRLFDCRVFRLDHPAFILRKGGRKSPMFIAFARNLQQIFQGVQNVS